MTEKDVISCPPSLIIPYTSTYSSFHRELSIRNLSNEPQRFLVQLSNQGKNNPFSIAYASKKLFSGEELVVRVDYKSGKDVTTIEEADLRIISSNQVKIVNVKATPVSKLRPGTSGIQGSTASNKLLGALGRKRASLITSQKTIEFPFVDLTQSSFKSFDLRTLLGDEIPIDIQWEASFIEPAERGIWNFSPENSNFSQKRFEITFQFTPVAASTYHQDIAIRFQYHDSGEKLVNISARISLIGNGIDSVKKQTTAYTLATLKSREPKYKDLTSESEINITNESTSLSRKQKELLLNDSSLLNNDKEEIINAHILHDKLQKKQLISKNPLQFTKNQIDIQSRLEREGILKNQTQNDSKKRKTRDNFELTNQVSTNLDSIQNKDQIKDKKEKEFDLIKKASEFREHEKLKEIKWFKEVGEIPPNEEEINAIADKRKEERELYLKIQRQQNRERRENDFSIGKPVVQLESKQILIEKAIEKENEENKNEILKNQTAIEDQNVEPLQTQKSTKSNQKQPSSTQKGKDKVIEPIPIDIQKAEPISTDSEEILVKKQLVSEFARFSNIIILQERVKRRLNFILQRTEEQNIDLALKEANIPRIDMSLIKIRSFPVPSFDENDSSEVPKIEPIELPTFKDFNHLNLKVPLEYKLKGYKAENPLPLNIYMSKQDLFDYRSLSNVPFPTATTIKSTQSSLEENHQKLKQRIQKCNSIILNHLYTPPEVDTPELNAFGNEEILPFELDPTYEILSENKKALSDAYAQVLLNKEEKKDLNVAVFRTYSEQFDEPVDSSILSNGGELAPLHPVVKRRNATLEEYMNIEESIPLKPFSLRIDNIDLTTTQQSSRPISQLSNGATRKEDSNSNPIISKQETSDSNFASILANYNLLDLYPELKSFIEAEITETSDKNKKKPVPKKGEPIEEEVPKMIKVNLTNLDFEKIVLNQLSNNLQLRSVE